MCDCCGGHKRNGRCGVNAPICDFVKKYNELKPVRLHMPGHKGAVLQGFEPFDITETDGADELFAPKGIIAESEKNASTVFGAQTFYSAGGSTLCIQSMLYLMEQYAAENDKPFKILAGRNAHRAFINAAALLEADVEWFFPEEGSYHSCKVTAERLEKRIRECMPTAVYLTSPDYLGCVADIAEVSEVCRRTGVLLAVDNAHGAYLRFLRTSRHPIDLGADICCDSAHKTLPVITGGAYLHISDSVPRMFAERAKTAFSLFGSSSPSYLILQSLDAFNGRAEEYSESLRRLVPKIDALKEELSAYGYRQMSEEPLKIALGTKIVGYTAEEIAGILEKENIYPEFYDADFIVFMFSPQNVEKDIETLRTVLLSVSVREPLLTEPPRIPSPERVMTPREALLMPAEYVPASESIGRICALTSVGCPPAIPIAVCGERIDENVLENFNYYGIDVVGCCKEP